MTFYETMQTFGLPIEYGRITNQEEKITPPFLIYVSEQTEEFNADDIRYKKQRVYRLEYYFENKNEKLEDALERFLEDQKFTFTNSGDIFIETENLFVIYYEVYTGW